MITGAHAIVYSRDADADRAFFRDVLGFPSVDAGGGWRIFALPPAELAATVAELQAKGVEFTAPVSDQGFGLLTSLKLPGGGELGLYEPRHPIPHA